ncbi:hypothetical protein KIW84_023312 [Lathyrus oleraceus]|uniref:Uncharacterized protein n=1 Tax=Pisum sativum TaxID=3888 RepID=A0A9D4VWE3_PEA|nr:hypothetical protein KIW84_076302 [Pisum sativum]KAI5391440.1 hypothetical protein KIW84_076304 [Pisum sativum]KAI5391857.1 hypothetical protein KIW84_076595 [Pisum sativum]KAI5391859.1 hypothetical protein KIW84_076597 [Pisum sativum]KAI5437138.1 hypothetical protein KIW84_023312 [Pisum sativum]
MKYWFRLAEQHNLQHDSSSSMSIIKSYSKKIRWDLLALAQWSSTCIMLQQTYKKPSLNNQHSIVGTNGSLTYRLNLDGFPAIAWAVTYFAEIEDLSPIESSCCRPPSECGYPAVNASYYDLSFHPVSPNHDCKRYKKILELSNAIVVILARPAWRNT